MEGSVSLGICGPVKPWRPRCPKHHPWPCSKWPPLRRLGNLHGLLGLATSGGKENNPITVDERQRRWKMAFLMLVMLLCFRSFVSIQTIRITVQRMSYWYSAHSSWFVQFSAQLPRDIGRVSVLESFASGGGPFGVVLQAQQLPFAGTLWKQCYWGIWHVIGGQASLYEARSMLKAAEAGGYRVMWRSFFPRYHLYHVYTLYIYISYIYFFSLWRNGGTAVIILITPKDLLCHDYFDCISQNRVQSRGS